MRNIIQPIIVICVLTGISSASMRAFTSYTSQTAWQAAAGSYTTITFTDLPDNTLIVDQYAALGVHFTDGLDFIDHTNSFITDGAGWYGADDSTTLAFDNQLYSIGIDFPGTARIKLYSNGQLIYTSPIFAAPPPGTGGFGGVISTVPFDSAILFDPAGDFSADNLYFGPPIPAPGGLAALISLAGMCGRTRRRSA